ncbi:BLUF domain-containing protein [Ramlibacter tataouinensis]|uniref:BLUF domain-containing protein n=1 Tax=Ramlibacter tataouinensis (strain ATCC BAA-407 / DSM 14655 / LMG 21543 / TTB310) TaxID=365046 RepID=F5Y3Q2_RAMTT|nr:BLUF domain-containing protein [Ramlibacter tataouinensis]AEG93709.1 Hypothetical protein Rta_26080 [Ramlibacter tataouinensis TTB310]
MTTRAPAFSLVSISTACGGPHLQDESALSCWLGELQAGMTAAHRQAGVHGLLVFAQGQFVQWLQGPEAAVRELMHQAGQDSWREQVQTLFCGADRMLLDEWSLLLVLRGDRGGRLDRVLQGLRGGQLPDAGEQTPAAIFRGLVHPPALQDGSQRLVGVIGQTGLWSGALLSHVSGKWKAPLHRTRLQGPAGLEREALSEYTEHPHPRHGSVRVVHYAGSAVAIPWLERTPERYDVVVLFYSSPSVEAALAFTATVVQRLGNDNASTRLVCLFGRLAGPCLAAVERWLVQQQRAASLLTLPLADSDAVWQAVEQALGEARAPAPAPAPTPAPAAAAPARPRPAAPAPLSAPAPAPTSPPAQARSGRPGLALASGGHDWLSQLLDIEGVGAVALAPTRERDVEPVLLLTGQVEADAAQRRRVLGEIACELGVQARLAPPQSPPQPTQVLTRYADRVGLSRALPDEHRSVLYVSTIPGYCNEALLLRGIELCVASTPPRLFERTPGAAAGRG